VPDSAGYNVVSGMRLKGALQHATLHRALNALIDRHETLRTSFVERDGRPVQVIAERLETPLPLAEATTGSESEREAAAQSFGAQDAQRPFDLTQPPLFRARLVRLAADDHVLAYVMRHIVGDGWSIRVFARDLCEYYEASAQGATPASSRSSTPISPCGNGSGCSPMPSTRRLHIGSVDLPTRFPLPSCRSTVPVRSGRSDRALPGTPRNLARKSAPGSYAVPLCGSLAGEENRAERTTPPEWQSTHCHGARNE
jgi:hypothetical protein